MKKICTKGPQEDLSWAFHSYSTEYSIRLLLLMNSDLSYIIKINFYKVLHI